MSTILSFLSMVHPAVLLGGFTLLCGFIGAPMIVWSAIVLMALSLTGISAQTFNIVLGITVLLNIPMVRRYALSLPIMQAMITLKFLPSISETEKVAIEAGDVWMDKELFSGMPNLRKMLKQDVHKLSKDEEAFINGPVEKLCDMVNDWEIFKNRKMPDKVWNYLKKEKFFGLIIPKEYGGLGFSPEANSRIVAKCASRSGAMGITVMVPNSLGPAELLTHYGTKEQKEHYLPRLADGREIPCFGLTEPGAGSDAGSMSSSGVVFEKNKKLYIRLNWEKRWITLSGVSTVIGLAFRLMDPDNLLGKGEDIGITCALIPAKTPGITIDTRHDPLGVPFNNCPLKGKNVVVPLDAIIGGVDYAGKGWSMLMECLSAGRGISLPASCTGGSMFMTRAASAYMSVRKQFGTEIGNFEGLHRPLATISGLNYLFEAARAYTCAGVGDGLKPPVISAICKYHFTELSRLGCMHAMDIFAGAGITLGPRNLVAKYHLSNPISITVEGANILTRTLMIFGQGAIRCHPHILNEVQAIESKNVALFDKAFMSHIGHGFRNSVRYLLLTLTRGFLSFHVGHRMASYYRRLTWVSAMFAFYSDIALLTLGGALKRKENLAGRFADVLSWMYLAMTVMRRYKAEGRKEDWIYAKWSLDYAFNEMQIAFLDLLDNLGAPYKLPAFLLRINPLGSPPSDKLSSKIAYNTMTPSAQRDRLTALCHLPGDKNDHFVKLEKAFEKIVKVQPLIRKVKKAIKQQKLPKKAIELLIDDAMKGDILTKNEAKLLKEAEAMRYDMIQVDAFTESEYRGVSKRGDIKKKLKDEFISQMEREIQDT